MDDTPSRPTKVSIRVFLFAEHQMVLETLHRFIDSNRDMKVMSAVGPTGLDQPEAFDDCSQLDVAVIYLSSGDQVQIVSRLMAGNPKIRVVVVADGADLESPAAAIKLGAVGIVQKNQNSKFLIEAIRQTYVGETWLNQVLLHRILERGRGGKRTTAYPTADDANSLTARELEVIQMIGEGLNNRELAKRLNISEATVRHHLSSIYGKLGVEDRVNMVISAHEKGLISYSG